MGPKRRAAASSRQQVEGQSSELAQEYGLSDSQENEIREAFSLFCINDPNSGTSAQPSAVDGVLKREDVRRCLISLGIQPSSSDVPELLSTLDPTSTGFVPFKPFLGLAAIYLGDKEDDNRSSRSRSTSRLSSPPADLSDEDIYEAPSSKAKGKAKARPPAKRKSKAKRKAPAIVVEPTEEEVSAAFQLFTKGGTGPITLAHLRRVARELKEDVSDNMLRDMILEANGDVDGDGDIWKKGVAIEEFEDVMKRAGVFG